MATRKLKKHIRMLDNVYISRCRSKNMRGKNLISDSYFWDVVQEEDRCKNCVRLAEMDKRKSDEVKLDVDSKPAGLAEITDGVDKILSGDDSPLYEVLIDEGSEQPSVSVETIVGLMDWEKERVLGHTEVDPVRAVLHRMVHGRPLCERTDLVHDDYGEKCADCLAIPYTCEELSPYLQQIAHGDYTAEEIVFNRGMPDFNCTCIDGRHMSWDKGDHTIGIAEPRPAIPEPNCKTIGPICDPGPLGEAGEPGSLTHMPVWGENGAALCGKDLSDLNYAKDADEYILLDGENFNDANCNACISVYRQAHNSCGFYYDPEDLCYRRQNTEIKRREEKQERKKFWSRLMRLFAGKNPFI